LILILGFGVRDCFFFFRAAVSFFLFLSPSLPFSGSFGAVFIVAGFSFRGGSVRVDLFFFYLISHGSRSLSSLRSTGFVVKNLTLKTRPKQDSRRKDNTSAKAVLLFLEKRSRF
jgi:hypothetical protein